MFNLTVAQAHTFYVGTQGWLVHNEVCPSAIKFGKLVPISPEARKLAETADSIFYGAKITKAEAQDITIATANFNGKLYVVLNGSAAKRQADAVMRIEDYVKSIGGEFQANRGGLHAEEFMYRYAIGNHKQSPLYIGVSHYDGPCASCTRFFADSGVEIGFTGIYK